ncbi:MAG: 50S ribosomal protein L21 [Gammaproteobacteria bacterium]|nr:50S ribosomal protein L21 [Gammaproteobacteria bacterium]
MYAVIQTGGKQYRIKEGDRLKIETLSHEVGEEINFDQVLLIGEGESVVCGTPYVANAIVKATVLEQGRHKKIRIIKFRRRKHHMKKMGHRQNYTQIEILSISK